MLFALPPPTPTPFFTPHTLYNILFAGYRKLYACNQKKVYVKVYIYILNHFVLILCYSFIHSPPQSFPPPSFAHPPHPPPQHTPPPTHTHPPPHHHNTPFVCPFAVISSPPPPSPLPPPVVFLLVSSSSLRLVKCVSLVLPGGVVVGCGLGCVWGGGGGGKTSRVSPSDSGQRRDQEGFTVDIVRQWIR